MTYTVTTDGVQEVESIVEEERRVAEDARQALVLLEKKRIALQTELDDLHVALENVRFSSTLLSRLFTQGCICHISNGGQWSEADQFSDRKVSCYTHMVERIYQI